MVVVKVNGRSNSSNTSSNTNNNKFLEGKL